MNKILITGGSGFLGKHLVGQLLSKYEDIEIRTLSRNERHIANLLANNDSDRLKPIIGDIRDIDVLKYALKGVDTVIHLAAMKHVDFCEFYPQEAITINIMGTMNLLKLFTGNTLIGMSTDKAAETSGCYGATKLLLEKMVLEQSRKEPERRYMIIRSGNLISSSGSVIEKWNQQLKNKVKITVTDLKMTRFFIDIDTLVDFIIGVMERGENGKIYIPFQKAASLGDLVKAVTELYGDGETELEVIGLREGERMHERLFLPSEKNVVTDLKNDWSQDSERLTIEDIKGWLIDSQEWLR